MCGIAVGSVLVVTMFIRENTSTDLSGNYYSLVALGKGKFGCFVESTLVAHKVHRCRFAATVSRVQSIPQAISTMYIHGYF